MPARVFSDQEVVAAITTLLRSDLKVSVFDLTGRLIWYCHKWSEHTGAMANPDEILGDRWLEFVHPADLEHVQKWIQAEAGTPVQFRACSGTEVDRWLVVAMTKQKIGRYWIAAGDNRPAREADMQPDPLPALVLLPSFIELLRSSFRG